MLRSTRQQYHQRIAQVLEAQFPETVETQPELLAHHYTEAGLADAGHPLLAAGGPAGQRALGQSGSDRPPDHRGWRVLATLPETPERTQQELDLQIALGPALMATKGYGGPGSGAHLCPGPGACAAGGRHAAALPGAVGLVAVLSSSRGQLQTARELGEQLSRLAAALHDPALALEAHSAGARLFWLGELARGPARTSTQAIALYDPPAAPRAWRCAMA